MILGASESVSLTELIAMLKYMGGAAHGMGGRGTGTSGGGAWRGHGREHAVKTSETDQTIFDHNLCYVGIDFDSFFEDVLSLARAICEKPSKSPFAIVFRVVL